VGAGFGLFDGGAEFAEQGRGMNAIQDNVFVSVDSRLGEGRFQGGVVGLQGGGGAEPAGVIVSVEGAGVDVSELDDEVMPLIDERQLGRDVAVGVAVGDDLVVGEPFSTMVLTHARGVPADQTLVHPLLEQVPVAGEAFTPIPLLEAGVVRVRQRLADDLAELSDQPALPVYPDVV